VASLWRLQNRVPIKIIVSQIQHEIERVELRQKPGLVQLTK